MSNQPDEIDRGMERAKKNFKMVKYSLKSQSIIRKMVDEGRVKPPPGFYNHCSDSTFPSPFKRKPVPRKPGDVRI